MIYESETIGINPKLVKGNHIIKNGKHYIIDKYDVKYEVKSDKIRRIK